MTFHPDFSGGLVAKPKMQILAKKIEPVANLMKVFFVFQFSMFSLSVCYIKEKNQDNKMT